MFIIDAHEKDKYITTHLYGELPEMSLVADDVEDLLKNKENSNERLFESSFTKRAKNVENEMTQAKKMTPL